MGTMPYAYLAVAIDLVLQAHTLLYAEYDNGSFTLHDQKTPILFGVPISQKHQFDRRDDLIFMAGLHQEVNSTIDSILYLPD